MPAGVHHMYACLIVHTYVRVCWLSYAYFARVCVCVCSCVSVFTMLNLPVVVCRCVCVQCMCLSLYLKLIFDSMCCGAVQLLVRLVVVSFMTLSAPCE